MRIGKTGFSLFEIMIVLVAIGLATGSVVAGASLLKSASLKNLNSEMVDISVALNQFRTEYNSIPGDFADATKFWGAADPNTNLCKLVNKTTMIKTCNGNGDNYVSYLATSQDYEMYNVWHHLSISGLLWGRYSGAQGSGGGHDHDIGINCPESKFSVGSGFSLAHQGNKGIGGSAIDADWFNGSYGHVLMFGKEKGNATLPKQPALTTQEMQKLDAKFDDGSPTKGIIVARAAGANPQFVDCTQRSQSDTGTTDNTHSDAIYRLSASSSTPSCQLLYRNILEK